MSKMIAARSRSRLTPLRHLLRADDATEAEMRRRGVDALRLPRGRPIAQAVIRRAEMRPTLDHVPRDVRPRPLGRSAAGALCRSARRGEAVARPLPDVAGHVVEPVAVRPEAADW